MLENTGTEIVHSKFGLLTTVAYKFGDQPAHYALEGGVWKVVQPYLDAMTANA